MLPKYWLVIFIAGVITVLVLGLSYHQVLAQQETDEGDPYPIATPTYFIYDPYPMGSPTPTSRVEPTPGTTPTTRVEPSPRVTPTIVVDPAGTPTSTFEDPPDSGPTSTWIPLPPFTLDFPAFSPTPSPTPTPTATQVTVVNEEDNSLFMFNGRIDRQVESIGILIVVIWLLLGSFLILYIKRLGY